MLDHHRRLVREARAAAQLDHPNICSIYEVVEDRNHSFIVMQYVDGETLANRIARKPIDTGEALEIASQIADALGEAHTKGIIHRDIKPQNIMITPRGSGEGVGLWAGQIHRTDQRLTNRRRNPEEADAWRARGRHGGLHVSRTGARAAT